MSPASAGGFSSTAPPGKPREVGFSRKCRISHLCSAHKNRGIMSVGDLLSHLTPLILEAGGWPLTLKPARCIQPGRKTKKEHFMVTLKLRKYVFAC